MSLPLQQTAAESIGLTGSLNSSSTGGIRPAGQPVAGGASFASLLEAMSTSSVTSALDNIDGDDSDSGEGGDDDLFGTGDGGASSLDASGMSGSSLDGAMGIGADSTGLDGVGLDGMGADPLGASGGTGALGEMMSLLAMAGNGAMSNPTMLQTLLGSLLGGGTGSGSPLGDGMAGVGALLGGGVTPVSAVAAPPAQVKTMAVAAAQKYGIDPALVLAVVHQESGFRSNAVSPAGAQGLMQLMPATAASLGVKNPLDAAQNLDGGVRYLAQQLRAFGGDASKALAAYNAGAGNVAKYNGIPPFPETQNYVRSILGSVEAYRKEIA